MALTSANTFAIAGGVVAAGAIGVAAVFLGSSDPASGPADTAEVQQVAASAVPADVVPDTVADVDEASVTAPTIDTFFRSPDDTTVIAGQAEAGQVVDIVLGGEVVETVTAGADGAFGTVVLMEAADQPRRMRVIADPAGTAIASVESIIVPPSTVASGGGATVLEAATEIDAAIEFDNEVVAEVKPAVATASETEIETAPVIALAMPNTTQIDPKLPANEIDDTIIVGGEIATGAAPQSSAAPIVEIAGSLTAPVQSAPPTLIADAGGVRILPPEVSGTSQPAPLDTIALDTITYDPSGEVLLAGRGAAAGGTVQIYIDNKPITTSPITLEGDWRTDLPDLDTGIYTLRVDEIDADGVVQSRIETPFKKEEPEQVAAILAEETSAEGFDIAVRTVQPGATLWAIAEEEMGEGILYVSVFEANRDLIRDPDLIYPGQVFRMPDASE